MCEIEAVEKDSFRNLPNLIKINLSSNNLKELMQGSIQDCNSLSEIDLHDNKLGLFPVEVIRMTETSSSIPSFATTTCLDFLKNVPNLMILNLSHCKLKVIRQDAFRYCPHLAYLDLSNNELQLIEFGALKNLSECNVRANPHLKEIDYMTQISAKLFSYDEKNSNFLILYELIWLGFVIIMKKF